MAGLLYTQQQNETTDLYRSLSRQLVVHGERSEMLCCNVGDIISPQGWGGF